MINNGPNTLLARRKPIVMKPKVSRVIIRPYIPGGDGRIQNIINRLLSIDEDQVISLLEETLNSFSHRHRYFREMLKQNFQRVADHVPDVEMISQERQLLIGTYFSAEYSVEAAALFNPSIVKIQSRDDDPAGSCRFVMSFRATGEGHVSSIEFRGGIVDSNNDIFFDALSEYIATPEVHSNPVYSRRLFKMRLTDMGANEMVSEKLFRSLPEEFTLGDLLAKLTALEDVTNLRHQDKIEATEMVMWLARSNYEISFPNEHPISERVIFPVSASESQGIEDARFVRFVNDDDSVIYYATYTAFNGKKILPQLMETKDFLTFKIMTLNGAQAIGKGMALFPRKIDGKYVMLSRQDGEHNSIMFSDNIHFWEKAKILQEPKYPYEFFQMGNAGSPIETPEGWLVITHGVGPLRTYCLGIQLLDLKNPSQIIGRLEEPILSPNDREREGYVPNVVYSCGSMIYGDELIIPYASADHSCSIATLPLPELMSRLTERSSLAQS